MFKAIGKVVSKGHTKTQIETEEIDKGLTRDKKANMKKVTPAETQIKNEHRKTQIKVRLNKIS